MAIRADEIERGRATVDIDRDRRLVLRHQDGDVEAFNELYRRYHGRLVGYCLRRVGDRDTAEELAQEAFVKALRAMPRFAGERRFYPWMTVIANRLCIDHHRRYGRVEPTSEVDAGTVEPDHDDLFAAVDREHLTTALARLTPRHREILDLREERGWSYHQIATHLDVPLTTVEALLHRARKGLRREYVAVAGDERGRRWGAALLGGGMLTRLKGWLAAAGPERWTPLLGTAAAGGLAVGLAVGPLPVGALPDLPVPAPVRASVVVAEPAAPLPVPAVSLPTSAPASGAGDGSPSPAGTGPTAAPPPAADLGVAGVYTGPEAAGWAEDQNDTQPVQVPIDDVLDVGLDPAQIVTDVLDPDDNGGTP